MASEYSPRLYGMSDAIAATHTCRNLSGAWFAAGPALATRFNRTALREGLVYDAEIRGPRQLARRSQPWHWRRDSPVPPLLVYRERSAGTARLPTADVLDWTAALRGRLVIFVGDSLAEHQATNLLMLASDRRFTGIEHVRRPYRPGFGESMHQPSWCRGMCDRERRGGLAPCADVHTVVCWLSAAKTESPSFKKRTLAHTTAWALGELGRSLTPRDIVVGSLGAHFAPSVAIPTTGFRGGTKVVRLAEDFVEVMRWHASGRWRRDTPSGLDALNGSAGGVAASASPQAQRAVQQGPHAFYREASPQFWREGVFPGRVGTSSKNHDCLPPWDFAAAQQAAQPQGSRRRDGRASNDSLDVLLGRHAFAAYNDRICGAVRGSPVSLLRVWLPSALLGSRESAVRGDCTHSLRTGSTYTFWNQLLLHEVWRREAEREGSPRAAPPPTLPRSAYASRSDTFRATRKMLFHNLRREQFTAGGVCSPDTGYVAPPKLCAPALHPSKSQAPSPEPQGQALDLDSILVNKAKVL